MTRAGGEVARAGGEWGETPAALPPPPSPELPAQRLPSSPPAPAAAAAAAASAAGSHPALTAARPPPPPPPRTVEVRRCLVGDEELGAVGVGAAVGHGHDAALGVLHAVANLVRKLAVGGGVDAAPALARARGVAALRAGAGPARRGFVVALSGRRRGGAAPRAAGPRLTAITLWLLLARSSWRAPPAALPLHPPLPARPPPHLDHEARDVSMEEGAGVVPAGSEGQEVLARVRRVLAEELQLEVAQVGVQRERLQGRGGGMVGAAAAGRRGGERRPAAG